MIVDGTLVWTRRWVQWVLSFACCTILGLSGASTLYYAYARSKRPITWGKALLYVLPDWYMVAAAVPLILWLGRRFRIDQPRGLAVLPLHLLFSLLFSISVFGLSLCIMWVGDGAPAPFFDYIHREFKIFFLVAFRTGIIIYWVILAIGYALDYFTKLQGEKQRAAQLEAQLSQAQLQALKTQLHPHFLFNTLHSISALLHEDAEAADRMVACLGTFLRLTLQNSSVQEVTLRLLIKTGGRVFFLKTDEIDWIEAEDNYVRLHVGKESHLVRETLSNLESQLDPRKFLRIHRSTMANIDAIQELQPWFNREYRVILHDGTQLTMSRNYRARLREALGSPLASLRKDRPRP